MSLIQVIQDFKQFTRDTLMMSSDMLHVYGGALFMLFYLMLFGNKMKFLPLILISLVLLVNEANDLLYYKNVTQIYPVWASVKDIINTALLPLLLLLFLNKCTKFYERKE